MNSLPTQQVPAVYHRRVGRIVVTSLLDGYQDVAISTVKNIPEADSVALLHAAFRPARRTSVNCFLMRDGSHTTLVDTGFGPGVRATVGWLPANLAAANVSPAEIDTVLLTHMHPDHWGGLTDQSGTPLFPGSELVLSQTEFDHWHDDAAMAGVQDPTRRKMFFESARAHVAPYRDRLRTFTGGEVVPGVTAVPLPGHTPGHTGYLIASEGETLLIWGDIVHVQELQVARPEVGMAVDVDPEQTVVTRRAILERVATERQAIAGMHLHFPGLAHIARDGNGFRLLPDAWSMDLAGDEAVLPPA